MISSMSAEQDVLSSVLAPLRLRGAYHSDWRLHHDWAVQGLPEPRALIHYVLAGQAVVTFHDGRVHELDAGDLAIFPRGAAHVVAATARLTAPYISDVLPHRSPGTSNVLVLGSPASPQQGRMLCAGLDYDHTAEDPLYRMLPDILVLRRDRIASQVMLSSLLQSILCENDAPVQGSETVQLRSFELAYLLALRLALSEDADTPASRALRHPHLGPALIAINTSYAEQWTVQALAAACGLSRSTFAREFTETLGQTPAAHLRARRLLEARRLLTTTSMPLEVIARAIGYASTIGLHQAFTRELAMTPGEFRRAHGG